MILAGQGGGGISWNSSSLTICHSLTSRMTFLILIGYEALSLTVAMVIVSEWQIVSDDKCHEMPPRMQHSGLLCEWISSCALVLRHGITLLARGSVHGMSLVHSNVHSMFYAIPCAQHVVLCDSLHTAYCCFMRFPAHGRMALAHGSVLWLNNILPWAGKRVNLIPCTRRYVWF